MTTTPWVETAPAVTYELESRRPHWHITRSGTAKRTPADRYLEHYASQEVDDADDAGHIIDDPALAGLLFCVRAGATIELRGSGRLHFAGAATLRVRHEPQGERLVLRAYLEHRDTGRAIELAGGRAILGAPTWFLLPQTAEIFLVPDTPPWALDGLVRQPRLAVDTRQGTEHLVALSHRLRLCGVPQEDLRRLVAHARPIDQIIASIEGDAAEVRVSLAARYGDVVVELGDQDPASPRHVVDGATFYRDLSAEAAARKVLTDLGLAPHEGRFVAQDDAAVDFWLAGVAMLPQEWERRVPRPLRARARPPMPHLKVRSKGSVLDLSASIVVDDEPGLLSLRALLRWMRDGRRWLTLSDGSVVKPDRQALQPLAEAAAAVEFDKRGHAEISTLEVGAIRRLVTAVPNAAVSEDVQALLRNMTREAKPPRAPKALLATLRDYQMSGFTWLWQLHRNHMAGILADDMGLGKTLQTIALLAKAREKHGPGPSIIVCPTSVLGVWKQEIRKWVPTLTVLPWYGADRSEIRRMIECTDVVVTTYTLLRRDAEALSKVKFRYAILDEAQHIKNAASATARSVKQLDAEHRLALTGTPIENRLSDLWAIFDFLAPGFLGSLGQFQRRFAADQESLEALRARIKPFVMRRRKEDVARELPKKTEQVLHVQLGRGQLALYGKILKTVRDEIRGQIATSGLERSQVTILAALTRLRQVCCDPRLLNLPGSVPASAKLEAFKELMSDCVASGRKVIVFSQFVEMQKLIGEALKELGIGYLWLYGATKDREALVRKFQSEDGPPVFLISLKAGNSGLTLTEADTVVHFDPWWNPAVEDQATDRAYRIGQNKPVMVYRLVCEGTVEQKMVELGASKRKVAEGALGRDAAVGKRLTMADVEALLEGPG